MSWDGPHGCRRGGAARPSSGERPVRRVRSRGRGSSGLARAARAHEDRHPSGGGGGGAGRATGAGPAKAGAAGRTAGARSTQASQQSCCGGPSGSDGTPPPEWQIGTWTPGMASRASPRSTVVATARPTPARVRATIRIAATARRNPDVVQSAMGASGRDSRGLVNGRFVHPGHAPAAHPHPCVASAPRGYSARASLSSVSKRGWSRASTDIAASSSASSSPWDAAAATPNAGFG